MLFGPGQGVRVTLQQLSPIDDSRATFRDIIRRMKNSFVTIEQARPLYAGSDSAHDFEHILRVMRMAEYLAQHEGGDVEICCAAALLHDIARHEEDTSAGQGEPVVMDHAQVSAEDARAFLLQNGADKEFAARVAEAIRSHRFRGTMQPETLEAKILYDADKLDSIGAIGVARAYAVCGVLNQKLFSEPKADAVATRQQHNAEHTPVDEFNVKLKHLRDRFFTPSARKIADERHAYMVGFFQELTKEVRPPD